MSDGGATFICDKIDALLTDIGWNPTSRVTVRLGATLPVGTYSDHGYCEGPRNARAALEA